MFSKVSGKKYTNVNVFWEKEYANLGNSQRIEFINKVIQNGFPINDLHLLAISENLNINIIIIHRAIYGTTEVEVVRGDIEDLILSSTFFKAPNNYINRPFLIFNKALQHCLCNLEITDHTIFQWTNRNNRAWGSAQHALRLVTHRQNTPRGLIHRNNRWLTQDHPLTTHVNQCVGRAKVHTHVVL